MNKNLIVTMNSFKTEVVFSKPEKVLSLEDHEQTLFVFDRNTAALFDTLPVHSVILNPGEREKRWESVQLILEKAVEAGLARDGRICGVGGGVICDMAAFAGSVYMRGCHVSLIPTSLLAMVDAALGGKTGFDFMDFKNMVGTFYPAERLYICPDFIKTLPEKEFFCGLGEVIKHGMLVDQVILDLLKQIEAVKNGDSEILETLIYRSIKVKADVVEQDLRESGVRAHLNLGHTFGHALETVTGFSAWSHGEAVAWGLWQAMKAGLALGVTDPEWAGEVRRLLLDYGYRLHAPGVDVEQLIDAIDKDKKKKGGSVRFVLQKGQGDTFQTPLDRDLLSKVLSEE